jgi:predicted metal-dependent enzyme (double-stranded beta helix superfamily)
MCAVPRTGSVIPFDRDAAQTFQAGELLVDDLAVHRWFRCHDRGGEFSRDDLELMVADLAGRPDLWSHLIRHSPDERYYVRLLLTDHVEIWLICWCPSQDTGFHDHAGSRGAVGVVRGAVSETLLAVGQPLGPIVRYEAGGSFSFGAAHIHDVQHVDGDPAASLHVYSPPLGEMGFYEVASDGTLRRRSGEYREEFC